MEWSVGHFVILDRILKSLTPLGRNQRNSLFGKLLRYVSNIILMTRIKITLLSFNIEVIMLSCKMCFDRQILVW